LQALRAEHADVLTEHNSQIKKLNEKKEDLEKQLKNITEEAEKLRQEATKVRNIGLDANETLLTLFLRQIQPWKMQTRLKTQSNPNLTISLWYLVI
jgi:flagellar biosynthesis chaperone FliJ